MSLEKEKELRDSLNRLSINIRAERDTMSEVVTISALGDPLGTPFVNYPDFVAIDKAIKYLECAELNTVYSSRFVKSLIEIEKLFKNSSTLKNHTLPNFRNMIPKETLIYADIDRQIDELENKSKNLLDRGYTTASESVEDIVESLREFNILLFEDKSISYEKYKNESIHLIRTEAFGLDEHRGCKEILVNLALLISTLGVAHIARYMNHGSLLFTVPTDTSNKIDNLEKIIRENQIHFPGTSKT